MYISIYGGNATMGAKNKVIAGDYEGGEIFCAFDNLSIIGTANNMPL